MLSKKLKKRSPPPSYSGFSVSFAMVWCLHATLIILGYVGSRGYCTNSLELWVDLECAWYRVAERKKTAILAKRLRVSANKCTLDLEPTRSNVSCSSQWGTVSPPRARTTISKAYRWCFSLSLHSFSRLLMIESLDIGLVTVVRAQGSMQILYLPRERKLFSCHPFSKRDELTAGAILKGISLSSEWIDWEINWPRTFASLLITSPSDTKFTSPLPIPDCRGRNH